MLVVGIGVWVGGKGVVKCSDVSVYGVEFYVSGDVVIICLGFVTVTAGNDESAK